MSDTDQKRQYFRLVYPVVDQPAIEIGEHRCNVIDISELGVKFEQTPELQLAPGDEITATIAFPESGKDSYKGTVLRIDAKNPAMTVVILSQTLPMRRIIEEQRRLIKKYKHRGKD